MIKARIDALRREMASKNIDIYLIGSEDFHGSEYVGDHFKCRAYMSGFTGSAGTLVVTMEEAGLWTDGRYFIQAEKQLQGSGIDLYKMFNEGVPSVSEWILSHVKEGQCLGFDGRTMGAREGKMYVEELAKLGATVCGKYDLVDTIWENRPALSKEPAWLLGLQYAGESREDRIANVRKAMEEKAADLFVLTSLDDIAWLLNIRGNDVYANPVVLSYVIMTKESLTLYCAEGIFDEAAAAELAAAGISFKPYNQIYTDLPELTKGKAVMYDGGCTNYAITEQLAADAKVIDETNPTLLPKAIKNAVECENIRQAHLKDGIALTKFMCWFKKNVGKVAMTEISVADKMESFRKEQPGYLEPSFDPISGYDKHAAIIHYSATPETDIPVEGRGLLLMDTGSQFLEGTTDITRTFACGPLTEDEKKFFTLVLRSNLNLGGVKFKHGVRGYNLDYVAREPLWQLGLDYNHGTGHGVGYLLNVHEGPNGFRWNIRPDRNEGAIFEEGMVTSNEPGYYWEDHLGIRHENMMICRKGEKTEYGQFMYFETVTLVPFDLDAVVPEMMTEREKQLLNDYHREIFEKVSPYLNEEEKAWLVTATRPI